MVQRQVRVWALYWAAAIAAFLFAASAARAFASPARTFGETFLFLLAGLDLAAFLTGFFLFAPLAFCCSTYHWGGRPRPPGFQVPRFLPLAPVRPAFLP